MWALAKIRATPVTQGVSLVEVERYFDGVWRDARHVHLSAVHELRAHGFVGQTQCAQAALDVRVEHLRRQSSQKSKPKVPEHVDGDALFMGLVGAVGIDQNVVADEALGVGQSEQCDPWGRVLCRGHAGRLGQISCPGVALRRCGSVVPRLAIWWPDALVLRVAASHFAWFG